MTADGLLKTFRIEIVNSARNPLIIGNNAGPTDPNPSSSIHPRSNHRLEVHDDLNVSTNLKNSYLRSGLGGTRTGGIFTFGRSCAFLCKNFKSFFTIQDVVGYNSNRIHEPAPTSSVSLISSFF